MNNKENILWITRTAINITLLIVLQAATAPLGNTLITGSIVNLMLILPVMTNGLMSGLSVAVMSPVIARFFGIGPLWSLIPFIAAGNITLVLIWHYIGNKNGRKKIFQYALALVIAAVAKFTVLYFGIVKVAIPFFLGLPERQAMIISGMFSLPQLLTASIGGVLAIIILPTLQKALGKRRE